VAAPLEAPTARFKPAVAAVLERVAAEAAASPMAQAWVAAGVPAPLAQRIASAERLYAALDVAEVAEGTRRSVAEVAEAHAGVGARLGLSRLRAQIEVLPADSHWRALAKDALGDDLAGLQRSITAEVLAGEGSDAAALLSAWESRNAMAMERAQRLLAELADAKSADLAMLSVALRELRHLA
jgi:glutamate dehydrogenase